jgi:hypothetical protein
MMRFCLLERDNLTTTASGICRKFPIPYIQAYQGFIVKKKRNFLEIA